MKHAASDTASSSSLSLHARSVALDAAQSGSTAAAAHLLGGTFGTVYAAAAIVAAISVVVTLRMPNTRLRETLHFVPVSE
jgi:hypothetical protein